MPERVFKKIDKHSRFICPHNQHIDRPKWEAASSLGNHEKPNLEGVGRLVNFS